MLLWILGVLVLFASLWGKPKRDRIGVTGVGVCERVRVGRRAVVFSEEEPWPQPETNRKLEVQM